MVQTHLRLPCRCCIIPALFCACAPQFSQKKADGQVRWSVLNVAALLRRHEVLHDKLAAAMAGGASVGTCVALIERELGDCAELLAP